MTREQRCAKIREAVSSFQLEGQCGNIVPYGSGHINDTFLLSCRDREGTEKRYILQRINDEIFKSPQNLMENIENVTSFLRKKILLGGGNPERETLNIVRTKAGKSFYKDTIGSFWRVYPFIEGSVCYDRASNPGIFYESAVAFGKFQKLLSDYPAATLHETIPNFHNTPMRFQNFLRALRSDRYGRAKQVQAESEFYMSRERDTRILMDRFREGELPLKVTHNDTKLNNVLFDRESGKALCVIDLDTIMPGFSVNDFGDSIRFGTNTGAEDERDLSKVNFDLGLFETYLKGFLRECGKSLSDTELQMLPWAAKLMTLECGMRFLTDYLNGDVYFKTQRPGQNLDRCRTQMKLVSDMEQNWDAMEGLVEKYARCCRRRPHPFPGKSAAGMI